MSDDSYTVVVSTVDGSARGKFDIITSKSVGVSNCECKEILMRLITMIIILKVIVKNSLLSSLLQLQKTTLGSMSPSYSHQLLTLGCVLILK